MRPTRRYDVPGMLAGIVVLVLVAVGVAFALGAGVLTYRLITGG